MTWLLPIDEELFIYAVAKDLKPMSLLLVNIQPHRLNGLNHESIRAVSRRYSYE